jgi:hypothetical protein
MPDWGKMNFHEHSPTSWDNLLPDTSHEAKDLVSQLVRYSGSQRISADLVTFSFIYVRTSSLTISRLYSISSSRIKS